MKKKENDKNKEKSEEKNNNNEKDKNCHSDLEPEERFNQDNTNTEAKQKINITDNNNEQIDYNEAAEEVLQKQNKKIRNQEEDISKIVNNCKNMEFLIKQLGLEERIKELGIKPITNNEMEDKDLEELRKKMINSNNMGDGEENKNP